jgi:hypothetical protein
MPVRVNLAAVLWCAATFVVGCRLAPAACPEPRIAADPAEIPEGLSETTLTVEVQDPLSDSDFYDAFTEITSPSGSIEDPFAKITTYVCSHDVSGPVDVCVNAKYRTGDDGDDDGSGVPGVSGTREYIGPSHIRIPDPLECSTTKCITVRCPEEQNECPVVSSLSVEPSVLAEGETATISVSAEDPDDNPQALATTLTARHGTIADPHALETTYTCDPDVGGAIEICVVASDGDSSCDAERCTTVRCPGDPLENTCPIIESLTVDPSVVPIGETTTDVAVDATDPDAFPVPMRIEWTSDTGVFGDRFASETTFTCGDQGDVEICVKANDGDPECDVTSCTTVRCPDDIPANLCPQLFVINSIPRVVPDGQTSTAVETRGQDTDGLPFPLTLTLNALWGSFENTENMQAPNNVVFQNATYICDRPGRVELCVDATDGFCTKTLCDNVTCPDTIAPP